MVQSSDAGVLLPSPEGQSLLDAASQCVELAANYAHKTMKPNGHWYTELRANVCFTAQYVTLRHVIGPPLSPREIDLLRHYILAQQNTQDGSWALAPYWPGDVSTSTEAYFALKLLGISDQSEELRRARQFILSEGGIPKVGVSTQLMCALFGIIPWDELAQVPAELILMPISFPLNIYSFSYWSRVAAVPIMILRHHKPVHPLQVEEQALFLDELFPNPADKRMRYTSELSDLRKKKKWGHFWATLADKTAAVAVEPWLKHAFSRPWSLSSCVRFIMDRTEPEAGFGGFWNSNYYGILGLLAEGFHTRHPVLQCMINAVEDFRWEDDEGLRVQVTVGPIWDTAIMALGLLESGTAVVKSSNHTESPLDKTVQWFKEHQILDTHGDCRVQNRAMVPGGWPFQYRNSWYPDNDDTLVAIMVMVMWRPEELGSVSVIRGIEFLLSMQCSDGGWGCFDIDNNSTFLNLFPFGKGNEFFDVTVPDITGRIVECFAFCLTCPSQKLLHPGLQQRMKHSCFRAIEYLRMSQDNVTGGWKSRWHVNYLNGTGSILAALSYFSKGLLGSDVPETKSMIERPLWWLRSRQNIDGGWGESLDSYRDAEQAGKGASTPTQTAWALLGLLAHLPPDGEAIKRGVSYLIHEQKVMSHDLGDGLRAATWSQERYVSVGFPSILWLDYTSSRHGYPMMALGRFVHEFRKISGAQIGLNLEVKTE